MDTADIYILLVKFGMLHPKQTTTQKKETSGNINGFTEILIRFIHTDAFIIERLLAGQVWKKLGD